MTDDNEQPTWFADHDGIGKLDGMGTKLIFLNACLSGTSRAQMHLLFMNTQTLVRDGRWPAPVPIFPKQVPPAFTDAIRRALELADPSIPTFYFAGHGIWDRPAPRIRTSFFASETLAVEPKRGLLGGLSPGQIFAIALIWVVAYVLPIYLYSQSPTFSRLIAADLATFAFAFEITCRILDKRK